MVGQFIESLSFSMAPPDWKQQPTTTASKWEATVTARVSNASADQIWTLLQDFFGIHKYFPGPATSYGVHGNNGEIGSIRHCEGFSIPAQESRGEDKPPPPVGWSREKIIAIDPTQRSLSYEMGENNIGFSSYLSTIRVQMDTGSGDGSDHPGHGCVLQWSFSVDRVEGLKFEDLVKKYEVGLKIMADEMEDALLQK